MLVDSMDITTMEDVTMDSADLEVAIMEDTVMNVATMEDTASEVATMNGTASEVATMEDAASEVATMNGTASEVATMEDAALEVPSSENTTMDVDTLEDDTVKYKPSFGDLNRLLADEVLKNLSFDEYLHLRRLNSNWNFLVGNLAFRELFLVPGKNQDVVVPIIEKYGTLCSSLGFVGAFNTEKKQKSELTNYVKLTPNINSIKLCVKGHELSEMRELAGIKYLAHLSLCSNYHMDQPRLIERIPVNLTSLHLSVAARKYLDSVVCPNLKVLTLACSPKEVVVPDNAKVLFPALSDLRLHAEFLGQGYTMLRVNFDTRVLHDLGAFKSKTNTIFSIRFNKLSDETHEKASREHVNERVFPLNEELSEFYNRLTKQITFPSFYAHIPAPFRYPSDVKVCSENKIDQKIFYNMFRADSIFIQYKKADVLKYRKVQYQARYVTIKTWSKYRIDFICWLQTQFTKLKELYLQRTLKKITWTLNFRSLEILHCPIDDLETLNAVIDVSPKLKVFYTALNEENTKKAIDTHPKIFFKKFNPNGYANADHDTNFHFCKHGF